MILSLHTYVGCTFVCANVFSMLFFVNGFNVFHAHWVLNLHYFYAKVKEGRWSVE